MPGLSDCVVEAPIGLPTRGGRRGDELGWGGGEGRGGERKPDEGVELFRFFARNDVYRSKVCSAPEKCHADDEDSGQAKQNM